MKNNLENVVKIVTLPPHTTKRCIFEQVRPKPATFKTFFSQAKVWISGSLWKVFITDPTKLLPSKFDPDNHGNSRAVKPVYNDPLRNNHLTRDGFCAQNCFSYLNDLSTTTPPPLPQCNDAAKNLSERGSG